jgi:hypothetical protein
MRVSAVLAVWFCSAILWISYILWSPKKEIIRVSRDKAIAQDYALGPGHCQRFRALAARSSTQPFFSSHPDAELPRRHL